MPKVMMPVEAKLLDLGMIPTAGVFICDNPLFTTEGNSKSEALAAAKKWVLENGGTWEEDESTGNQEGE